MSRLGEFVYGGIARLGREETGIFNILFFFFDNFYAYIFTTSRISYVHFPMQPSCQHSRMRSHNATERCLVGRNSRGALSLVIWGPGT
jgi:hypothetical protein